MALTCHFPLDIIFCPWSGEQRSSGVAGSVGGFSNNLGEWTPVTILMHVWPRYAGSVVDASTANDDSGHRTYVAYGFGVVAKVLAWSLEFAKTVLVFDEAMGELWYYGYGCHGW